MAVSEIFSFIQILLASFLLLLSDLCLISRFPPTDQYSPLNLDELVSRYGNILLLENAI